MSGTWWGLPPSKGCTICVVNLYFSKTGTNLFVVVLKIDIITENNQQLKNRFIRQEYSKILCINRYLEQELFS